MMERPILFSGPMVRAILDNSKHQTRRIIKLPPWVVDKDRAFYELIEMAKAGKTPGLALFDDGRPVKRFICGGPGERLWVRETWALENLAGDGERVVWAADRAAAWRSDVSNVFYLASEYKPDRWRPSIYMPRWASRITLDVKTVRIERVQDITDADAEAEGVVSWARSAPGLELIRGLGFAVPDRPRFLFQLLWVGINGQESWDENPYVLVRDFKRVEVSCES